MIALDLLQEVNSYIREYLQFHGMNATLQTFDEEVRTRQLPRRLRKEPNSGSEPRLHALFAQDERRTRSELGYEKELQELNRRHKEVTQAARQIFAVSINFLQGLTGQKEVVERETVMDLIEAYKAQLGRYHRALAGDGDWGAQTETVMQDHKQRLLRYWREGDVESVVEVCLSLRVNALQIAPELRKNLVYELVRGDIFGLDGKDGMAMITKLVASGSAALRNAALALVSIIAATLKGVEYLTRDGGNTAIVKCLIQTLRQAENSSVTQRFCVAALQKCSVKESVIPLLIDGGMIDWTLELLGSAATRKTHTFTLDFASALLANILHSPQTLAFLDYSPEIAKRVLEALLAFIRANLPVSVLMHVLIAISYLAREPFQPILAELRFVDRIAKFVESYSQLSTTDDEALEIDKKTVLDLCAHMFHPKDGGEHSASFEGMALSPEDRIREYENEQGELIFECFEDETN